MCVCTPAKPVHTSHNPPPCALACAHALPDPVLASAHAPCRVSRVLASAHTHPVCAAWRVHTPCALGHVHTPSLCSRVHMLVCAHTLCSRACTRPVLARARALCSCVCAHARARVCARAVVHVQAAGGVACTGFFGSCAHTCTGLHTARGVLGVTQSAHVYGRGYVHVHGAFFPTPPRRPAPK